MAGRLFSLTSFLFLYTCKTEEKKKINEVVHIIIITMIFLFVVLGFMIHNVLHSMLLLSVKRKSCLKARTLRILPPTSGFCPSLSQCASQGRTLEGLMRKFFRLAVTVHHQ